MLPSGCPADGRYDSIARVDRADPHTNAVAPGSATAPIAAASSRNPTGLAGERDERTGRLELLAVEQVGGRPRGDREREQLGTPEVAAVAQHRHQRRHPAAAADPERGRAPSRPTACP